MPSMNLKNFPRLPQEVQFCILLIIFHAFTLTVTKMLSCKASTVHLTYLTTKSFEVNGVIMLLTIGQGSPELLSELYVEGPVDGWP